MTTPPRIDQVTAARFRGASRVTTLSFDPSKRFVLLFGENGTGKSTMIDAIDMVCNRNAGTLACRSSVTLGKHLPTIGSNPGDLYAEVSTDGKKWRATLKGARIDVVPPTDTPLAAILRRQKVLRLVEATPSERFAELKQFIDVDGVQNGEDALPKAIKEVTTAIDARVQDVTTAEGNLKHAFDENHTPEEQMLGPKEWAKRRVESNLTGLQSNVVQLKTVLDAYTAAFALLEAKNASQQDLTAKRSNQDAVKQKIAAAKTIDTQTGIVLVDLLNKAGEYLMRRPDVVECPVCQQSVIGSELANAIRGRLDEMTDLKALAEASTQAEASVRIATENTRKCYVGLINKAFEMAKQLETLGAEHKGNWVYDKTEYANLIAWTGTLTKHVIAETDHFMASLPPLIGTLRARHESLNKQAIQLTGIKRDYDMSLRAKKEAEQAFAVRTVLESMLKAVRKERIAYIQGILDHIADECDRLYALVHEGERLGGVRFALDQEKKGSLLQSAHFEGYKGVAPQAYFSDSHLDTLAFCFFLSVTRHTLGKGVAVIIDDVFTSVDLNHIGRILDMLLDAAKDFNQVILATHQRRWLDLFRTQRVAVNDACIVELRPWSLDTGIYADNVMPYLDELRASLAKAPMNRREIGSLSGFLIESILGEMTKHLNCSIKRNARDKFTASDILCSMTKPSKLLNVNKGAPSSGTMVVVSDGPPPLHQLVTDLGTMLNDVRNTVGDHFNWDAAEIPDKTVREFGQKVAAACVVFLCDTCGGMATKDKGTHLQCGCGKLTIVRN